MESISNKRDRLCDMVGNLQVGLLKLGGKLILSGVTGNSFYSYDEATLYHSLNMNKVTFTKLVLV